MDEPLHLAAGLRNWQFGSFDLDRGNPPFVGLVAAAPVLLANPRTDWSSAPDSFSVGQDFVDANGARSLWLITLGRWACLPFSLVGAYVCYRWAFELHGFGSALMALALWCFCPNLIGHGQVITGDTAATAAGLCAFYFFWKWLREPTFGLAIAVGLVLGLAQLTKFVWVVLYLLWPILWLLWRFIDTPQRSALGKLARQGLQMLLMAVVSVYVINIGYAFDPPFASVGDALVGRKIVDALRGLRGVEVERDSLASVPLPLPGDYVAGIGEISERADARPATYLRGARKTGGWWYYYPYAMLIKMPLGTLALVVLACVSMFFNGRNGTWKTEAVLLAAAAAVTVFVTWSGTSQRLRYILPVLPLLFVFAARTGRWVSAQRPVLSCVIGLCLSWSIVSSLLVYPHSASYFNELVGGPLRGDAHLIESNIDWGQDLLYLRDWVSAHPEAQPLHLAYFGRLDPSAIGIDFSLPPKFGGLLQPEEAGLGPQPGWHVVSVNLIRGVKWNVPAGRGGLVWMGVDEYGYFRYFRPVERAGYTLCIYHITDVEAEDVRRRLGVRVLPGERPASARGNTTR